MELTLIKREDDVEKPMMQPYDICPHCKEKLRSVLANWNKAEEKDLCTKYSKRGGK